MGPGPEQTSSTHTQTVLLVDDEEDILESLDALLFQSLKGIRILTARSGAGALHLLGTEHVDLILTDYRMPGMNGLEFLREALKVAPQVPRVLITAFPDMGLALKSIQEARIERFITKPLDPARFPEMVHELLSRTTPRGTPSPGAAPGLLGSVS